VSAASALTRRAFTDGRVRTIGFAYLFAFTAYVNVVGYRHSYPTLKDRLGFARSFGDNKAIRLFYGEPHDLLTVGGYTAWRVGGILAIFAAVWGLLAAVRALRAEEDSGRAELVLAAPVGRRTVFRAAMAAIAAGTVILWLALLAGLLVAGLPVGSSAYLALSVLSVVPVFVGVGALTSQLAPTRRIATELGGAVITISFVLRVIADTSSAGWLRWATPLGWAEELRPFAGPHPLVLLLMVTASALLLGSAARVSRGRDVGSGVLAAHDSAAPRLRLLSSPLAQALRTERTSLLVWLGSVAGFAFILGVVSNSVTSAGISESIRHELQKLGAGSALTPADYLGFTFVFFVFAVSLFVCAQIGAARHEESEQQLETLLALPVSRRGWLSGRLVLAGVGAALISLTAGAFAWLGGASQGVHVSLLDMLEAGANCLPAALLFLGIAALAYAILPRASAGIAYGLVSVAFVWQLFGAVLGAPSWLLGLSPFRQVGLVPTQPFKTAAALVMLALGALASATALAAFRRRDVIGS
jgi:ABC-2 type transport system permease protein